MGRWIVIISLAMAQCPDLAGAGPPTAGIPLPKPRPERRNPPAPAVKAPVALRGAWPIADSAIDELPAEESPVGDAPVQSSPAQPSPDGQMPGARTPAPAKSGTADGGCNGGKRLISAYYWQGSHTASGEPFNPQGMTAAHRTLPFGTRLTVSNPRTGKSVTVVINDRGPFVSGVSLDLSLGAAQALGMRGTGAVCVQ
jgi:rare lipoprotein A